MESHELAAERFDWRYEQLGTIWNRSEQYTIQLGNQQHHEQMIVKDGHVIFENGSIKVDALSFDNPSAIIDNARLT